MMFTPHPMAWHWMAHHMQAGRFQMHVKTCLSRAVLACYRGFTLIELLVVMAVLAMLASLVAPRYIARIDDARETVLRQNLVGMRSAIDQFYRDKARYPETLEELVAQRYIRAVPLDPITARVDSWVLIAPDESSKSIFDIKSGSNKRAKDGSEYASW